MEDNVANDLVNSLNNIENMNMVQNVLNELQLRSGCSYSMRNNPIYYRTMTKSNRSSTRTKSKMAKSSSRRYHGKGGELFEILRDVLPIEINILSDIIALSSNRIHDLFEILSHPEFEERIYLVLFAISKQLFPCEEFNVTSRGGHHPHKGGNFNLLLTQLTSILLPTDVTIETLKNNAKATAKFLLLPDVVELSRESNSIGNSVSNILTPNVTELQNSFTELFIPSNLGNGNASNTSMLSFFMPNMTELTREYTNIGEMIIGGNPCNSTARIVVEMLAIVCLLLVKIFKHKLHDNFAQHCCNGSWVAIFVIESACSITSGQFMYLGIKIASLSVLKIFESYLSSDFINRSIHVIKQTCSNLLTATFTKLFGSKQQPVSILSTVHESQTSMRNLEIEQPSNRSKGKKSQTSNRSKGKKRKNSHNQLPMSVSNLRLKRSTRPIDRFY